MFESKLLAASAIWFVTSAVVSLPLGDSDSDIVFLLMKLALELTWSWYCWWSGLINDLLTWPVNIVLFIIKE